MRLRKLLYVLSSGRGCRYRQLEKWEDAKRVAKTHGGKQAFEKVVLHQAQTIFAEHGPEVRAGWSGGGCSTA